MVSRAPTLDRGETELDGPLTEGATPDEYFIGGVPARFEPGKQVNGFEFDEISRKFFVGKNIVSRGGYRDGVYFIASVVEAGLFTAEPIQGIVGSADAATVHRRFLSARADYVLKTLPEFELSSGTSSFRGTVYDDGHAVHPGDSVLMLTMSGHQGDTASAVNGHVAVGLGWVRDDWTVDGEIYNVFIPPDNPKDVVSGSHRWIDYFGHVVSGQNNYRPGYTWMIYGVDPARLQRVRENLEPYHSFFRVTEKQMSVSVNCATLTAQAMAREGIYGLERNGRNGSNRFPLLPEIFAPPHHANLLAQAGYVTSTPKAEYLPRSLWESIFLNLTHLNSSEALGVHRVDFVFYGQTPSHRPRGGIAADGVGDELRAFLNRSNGLDRVN